MILNLILLKEPYWECLDKILKSQFYCFNKHWNPPRVFREGKVYNARFKFSSKF